MQEQLEMLIQWKEQNPIATRISDVWEICHDLAEAQYQPALEFFWEGLSDPYWAWRQTCLQMIGFHFSISSDSEIAKKVRELLLIDPDKNVRMTAANVLGRISTSPEPSLVSALTSDLDWVVRKSAYLALLQLTGASYDVFLREEERLNSKEHEPTLQDMKRILAEEGIEVPSTTFDSENPSEKSFS